MSYQEKEALAPAQGEMSLHTSQEVNEYVNVHGPFSSLILSVSQQGHWLLVGP